MSEAWIFGYGSLIWRPDFDHAEARPAAAPGWARRFWQGSTDHRGVPGAPGRVVTLVPASGAVCRGMAYRVTDREAVVARLDRREKGSYAPRETDVFLDGADAPVAGIVYVAAAGNPNWLGRAEPDDIARQVLGAAGPSGSNLEYVVELARALHGIGADDLHVSSLADRLRRTAGPAAAGRRGAGD